MEQVIHAIFFVGGFALGFCSSCLLVSIRRDLAKLHEEERYLAEIRKKA